MGGYEPIFIQPILLFNVKIQLQTTNRMLERFIYKRFCLNEMYANNCAHVRHFCYCRYICRRGNERIKIACR